MLMVFYTPGFIREYDKLPKGLQQEVKERIELFRTDPRHPFLRVHKLKGALRKRWSFSVNYSFRIVFEYDSKNSIALLAVGNHSVYE